MTVGFCSRTNTASGVNADFGFWAKGGHFHKVAFPAPKSAPPVDQLLGVGNSGVAVGLRKFRTIALPSSVSVTAAAINSRARPRPWCAVLVLPHRGPG